MLEGKNVTLKTVEKEDIPQLEEWLNNPEFIGQYDVLVQTTKTEMEKWFEKSRSKGFFIQKKDGTKIGHISSREVVPEASESFGFELAYALLPGERSKGYMTEAINILLDFLFLSSQVFRIQAHTDIRNSASQRVLEKTGFKKEGITRKGIFYWGELRDTYIYSILRDEWKEPRILKGAV